MKKQDELFEGTNEQLHDLFHTWADIFSPQKPKKMNIIEFDSGSLNEEFKEQAEWIFGRHYQEFTVTAYTSDEENYFEVKFCADGIILDQAEIDNLDISVITVDDETEIDEALKSELEYKLKELFEL